ncbi:MAG: hypothetical protein K2W96_08770, partial [Gemmataceae bacterium]|nr:hypothetical protein [Gemmataceae bacterium]
MPPPGIGDRTIIPSGRPAAPPAAVQPAAVTPPPASLTKPEPALPPASEPAAPPPAAEPSGYKILGSHRRRVTIIVDSPGSAFLPDDQLNFLTKILEACRMNIGDVAIVNHHTTPVAITALRQQLQPSVILIFGLEPTAIRLPINFPVFKL